MGTFNFYMKNNYLSKTEEVIHHIGYNTIVLPTIYSRVPMMEGQFNPQLQLSGKEHPEKWNQMAPEDSFLTLV